ncbi:Mus38-like protein [Penicillium brevicompactum]|uniref:Mus38-like protein n=1 Tax=Penicillium brevicompactum TaxID=5074 RepID=A0A9W9R1R2_PENBR|nr:Mus38-like protein [Penicillium brevicompactum]
MQIQGAFSYTVTAGFDSSKLFQFRTHDSSIDLSIAALAEATHAEFVALVGYHGTIGTDRPLHIYEMDKFDGIPYIMARDISHIDNKTHKFSTLVEFLPPRFKSSLLSIRKDLPSNFSGALPFVISHGDLCEMNMLVNPENGKLTGIVDWAEARILPFGFSLWRFENVLGFMDSEGWHYYDNRRELEDLFWNSFRAEIRDSS